jgi:ABC-type dipeptide/oligopeptide/nickel transport system permease subunit
VSSVDTTMETAIRRDATRRRRAGRLSWILHSKQAMLALLVLGVVLAIALIGPLVAPHSISQPIGLPGEPPTSGAPLGTDNLGRDVLSRVLHGGFAVLWLAVVTVVLTYLIGMAIGMTAGLSGSVLDTLLMRFVDIFLVFPPLLLLLLLLDGSGSGDLVLIIGIVLVMFPGVARLVRTATLEVSRTGYIEAALARGEGRLSIMRREVLPNILQSVLADLGVRFAWAIILAASVNFLGLGAHPPAANWGLMISENRPVIATNPWAVISPAVPLALLTISVNLLSDAYVNNRFSSGGNR